MRLKILCFLVGTSAVVSCAHKQAAPVDKGPTPAGKPIVWVDEQPIFSSSVETWATTQQLSFEGALDEQIDWVLLQNQARKFGIATSDSNRQGQTRTQLEQEVCAKLQLSIPMGPAQLQVSHAWIKDAEKAADKKTQRKDMDKLRSRVDKGEPFQKAWETLKLDGSLWHVADDETYPVDILPVGVQELGVGALSNVTPGDGGLHLFRIINKLPAQPDTDAIRANLRAKLREQATIRFAEPPANE